MIKLELCWSSDKFITFYHCTYQGHANFPMLQLRLGISAEDGDGNVVEVVIECFSRSKLGQNSPIAKPIAGKDRRGTCMIDWL